MVRALVAVACVAFAGCFQVSGEVCSDGRVCPHGSRCDVANDRCISPEQVAACANAADGDPCEVTGASGTCMSGVCEPARCGDGQREPSEVCDGDDLNGLDCTAFGYYPGPGLVCTDSCTFNHDGCVANGKCGDGTVNGPELCDGAPPAGTCVDYGFDVGHLGCSKGCTVDVSACGYLGWRRELLPTVGVIRPVWASSPHDLYVIDVPIGPSTLLHYDGHAWMTVSLGTSELPVAIAGTSASDVFVAVGSQGDVMHWDGHTWQLMPFVTGGLGVNDLTAVGTDIFAVGYSGTIVRYDGQTWRTMSSGTSQVLRSVWGHDVQDVWVVGDVGTLLHFDGATWSPFAPAPPTSQTLLTVRELSSDLYVTDAGGTVYRWDGANWTVQSFGGYWIANTRDALFGALGFSMNALTADHAHWLSVQLGLNNVQFETIANDPTGHLWAGATAGGLFTYQGTSWSTLLSPTPGVWAADPTDVFFSDCTMSSSSGSMNRGVGPCGTGPAVWGTDKANVYVSANNAIWHFDGMRWSVVYSLSDTPTAIAGSASSDVYAVGRSCAVFHSTGSAWASVDAGQCGDLYGVWASDPSHVFAVGSKGVVQYDGTQWLSPIDVGVTLYAVWGTGPSDIWAVGDGGTIVHFDGTGWTKVESHTGWPLYTVWGTAQNDVFAGGLLGTLLHFDGVAWGPIRNPEPTFPTITSISGDGRRIFFGNSELLLDRTSQPTAACAATETNCNDAIDDDCDFLVDCADPDCKGKPECP
jgi:hypothetical protein